MKAMILAAGMGSRLLPLTRFRPKPLFPIYNVPLLRITIEQLERAGIRDIIINTHHLGRSIERYLTENTPVGVTVSTSHEEVLLGTGGAIRKVADFWNDSPFIVVNGDIIHTIDLAAAYRNHLERKNLATLVLHNRPLLNRVEIDEENTIVGIRGRRVVKPVSTTTTLAFTGIQVISPRLLKHIPPDRHSDIITIYLQLMAGGAKVNGYPVDSHYWLDIGTPDDYHRIHRDIHLNSERLGDICTFSSTDAGHYRIGQGATLAGYLSLGRNSTIGDNCTLKNSILWSGVTIGDNLTVEGCILGDNVRVEHSMSGQIVI